MKFLESIDELEKYYRMTLEPGVDENLLIEEEKQEFNPTIYNNLVRNLLLEGLYFKIKGYTLFNEKQYSNYLGLVSDRNNLSEEAMFNISEFLPKLFKITKVLEGINKEDAACLIYLLDPKNK